MSYCILLGAIYWDLCGGHFCAADSHHKKGVIPFRYDNGYKSKLTLAYKVHGLYIYTKFHHVLTTVSDTVVDYSRVRGWLFRAAWANVMNPYYIITNTNQLPIKLLLFILLLFFIWHELLFLYSCMIISVYFFQNRRL